jgi:hypothetical protein
MTDDDLDRAIDVAVREMMRVESSADVRARVLPRLRRSEPRLFTWPRLVFAAASLLLLAFALMRAPKPTPVTEVATTPAATTPRQASSEAPATTPQSASPMLQASRNTPGEFELEDVATSQVELAPTVPPLGPIEPLTVEPPRPPDIEPDAIVIAPLPEIPDVRVEPLFPASGPQ